MFDNITTSVIQPCRLCCDWTCRVLRGPAIKRDKRRGGSEMLDRRSSSRCLRAVVHPLRTHTAHYAHKHTRKYMRREDFATTSCVPNRLAPLFLTLRCGYCCARANTALWRFLEVANASRLVSHMFRTRRECESERLVLGNILRQSQKFVSHDNYDST